MTMSILDLLQHIVNEPAPKLGEPWGDESTQGRFVDDCLRKDPNERPSPAELLVSSRKRHQRSCFRRVAFTFQGLAPLTGYPSSIPRRFQRSPPGWRRSRRSRSTSRRGRRRCERNNASRFRSLLRSLLSLPYSFLLILARSLLSLFPLPTYLVSLAPPHIPDSFLVDEPKRTVSFRSSFASTPLSRSLAARFFPLPIPVAFVSSEEGGKGRERRGREGEHRVAMAEASVQ